MHLHSFAGFFQRIWGGTKRWKIHCMENGIKQVDGKHKCRNVSGKTRYEYLPTHILVITHVLWHENAFAGK